MEFKVVLFDISQGRNEIILDPKQAELLDVGTLDRVKLTYGGRSVVAVVDVCKDCVADNQIGLFTDVAEALKVKEGARIKVEQARRPASIDSIKKKLDGGMLSDFEIKQIISDLMSENLSRVEMAIFIAGVYTRGLSTDETVSLTNAIYESGGQMRFSKKPVVSEHSIGGVAGDRTSMILVPIISSLGLVIPKTATRAISSAAGTADVMEVLCKVDLTLNQAMAVVKKTNGCLIWGGNVGIAAADDKLIQIRNPLHLDPKALLLSSILAKKKAEGAEMALLDLPIGRGAKLASREEAVNLAKDFQALGAKLGMKIECTITDGSEPLMPYVGPCLEARAVLNELKGKTNGELLEKALAMSGYLISMARDVSKDEGYKIAKQALVSGKALAKMREIIQAQGGDPDIEPEDIEIGKFHKDVFAKESGKVSHIDNKVLSTVARTLGAPQTKEAGLQLHVMKGRHVDKGDKVVTLYANNKDKLGEAEKLLSKLDLIEIGNVIMQVI